MDALPPADADEGLLACDLDGWQKAGELGVTLLWLPKRSPELNPMDTLWGHAKKLLSANKQYETSDDHVGRFVGYLRDLTSLEALTKAGVLSEGFWLKSAL